MKSRVFYAALFGLAAASAFAKTLVFAGVLAGSAFGVVALAILTATIASYPAAAGILDGLSREVPLAIGRGQNALILRREGIGALLISTTSVTCLVATACLILASNDPSLSGLEVAPLLLLFQVATNAILQDLQSRELSHQYAIALTLKSGLAIPLALLLSRYGPSGVIAAEAAACLVTATIAWTLWSRDLLPSWPTKATVRSLTSVGLPFTAGSLLANLSGSVDRWALQFSLGVAALGTYSFGMHFTAIGLVILNMLQLYATPRLIREYGKSGDIERLLTRSFSIVKFALAGYAIMFIPFLMAFPWMVKTWFPAYADAAPLAVWIYLGTAASTLGLYDIAYRATANGRQLIILNMLSTTGAALFAVAIWLTNASLSQFAASFAAVRILTGIAGWKLIRIKVSTSAKKH